MRTTICKKCNKVKSLRTLKTGAVQFYCKKCVRDVYKRYYHKNEERIRAQHRKYYSDNKIKCKLGQKAYRDKDATKIRRKEQEKDRYNSSASHRINKCISSQIYHSIKDKQGDSWRELVGYGTDELKSHLENLFKEGMTWENHGSFWHMDHVIPLSWFNFESKNDPEFKLAWKLENLQPLKAIDNLRKNNRYEG